MHAPRDGAVESHGPTIEVYKRPSTLNKVDVGVASRVVFGGSKPPPEWATPERLIACARCRLIVKIVPFEMERWQSTWEHTVDFNLSESGVQPISLRELLQGAAATERLLDSPLAYPQGNGTIALRSLIAGMYRGATPEHILVTNGSSEAILLAMWHLVEKGDEVVVMLPNYMETWGLVQMFGGKVKPLALREDLQWQFDPDDIASLVTRKTKAIAVCNPDNPTGAILGGPQRKALLDAARDSDAWLLSDEVYIGAEREAPRTETLWGSHAKTLITNGLSKAYGLPGLRIGWLAGPPETIAALWGYHDYTTLTPTCLSDRLAQIALAPDRREELFARTQGIIQKNYGILRAWIEGHGSLFSHVPPAAGAICFLRYALDMNSSELARRLRTEKSTLIVPGDHFGMDGYIRIGIGNAKGHLVGGLDRIDAFLRALKAGRGTR